MRFLRLMIYVGLVLSLALNFVLYSRNKRRMFSVNGQNISKKEYTDYLEQKNGLPAKAELVERMLVDQEAIKQGVAPSQQEVDDKFNEQKELNWQFARAFAINPWEIADAKRRIRETLEKERLITKDVPVTEEQTKDEYNSRPQFYDTPAKAKAYLAVVLNEAQLSDIKALMEKNDPPVSPTVIMSQYRNGVTYLGEDNKFTFQQLYGTKQNDVIFSMKPNEVKQLPPMEFQKQGAKALLVKLLEPPIPGKKADLNDPKVKEKLRMVVAARSAKPWQELFSTLWANARFESDDASDKKLLEQIWFPDRARAEANR